MTKWEQTNTAVLIQGGVLEIGDGYRAKNSEFVQGGGLPFVRVGNVKSSIELDGLDELPISQVTKYQPKTSKPYDSLITMKGTVGRVAFVLPGIRAFVYSPQLSYWRTHDASKVHPRWLRYWLESPEFAEQASATKGSTDMADYINLRDQRQMRMTLPPITAQARIADVLGTLDDLIENNLRRVEVLEDMARAIYREWFVHFRYPGHEDTSFVDSPLGPIPEGWNVSPLAEVTDLDRTTVHPARSPGEEFSHYSIPAFDAGMLPVLERGADIKSGKFVVTSPAVMVSKLNPRTERTWFAEPRTRMRSLASTEFMIVRPRGELSLEFLYQMVRSDPFQQRLRELSSGTSTSHQRTKPADVLRLMVLVPEAGLVARFTEDVDAQLRLARDLRISGQRLTAIRDTLLPRLVTGQIDVSLLDLDTLGREAVA